MAQAKTYALDCTFKRMSRLLPENVRVVYDAATEKTTVVDELTKEFAGGAVAGTAFDNSSRQMFKWSVRTAIGVGNWPARLDYTLTIFKDGRSPTVRVRAVGFTGDAGAKGTCARSGG